MARKWNKPTTTLGIVDRIGPKPRIALLRGGGLGDFISTTAALRALRVALPEASITLITSPNLSDFVHRYSEINRIIVAPPYRGVIAGEQDESTLAEFFEAMRLERYDLALQWHGGGTYSNEFVRRLGARITAGFKGDDAPPLDYWIPYDIRQHEVLRYLDVVRLLGIEATDFRTFLPVLSSDREDLAALDGTIDLNALERGRYMGVHTGAGAASRRWPADRYAQVVDKVLEEFDLEGVLVTSGPGQEESSAAVVERMAHRERAIDLGGMTTLGCMVALIAKLACFLTNDSGPSHMALALNVPSVVVFGSAHPVNWAPLDRTTHRIVAHWDAPCRWMVDDGCDDTSHVRCLQGVKPEMVLAETRQLLHLIGIEPRSLSRI